LKALGPTTVVALTGRDFADQMTLSLAEAPISGVVCSDGIGGVRYVLAIGQAIGRRALMDLLYTLAPYKAHGPDRFSRVLDNWSLYERAATGGASQALLEQHANSLKNSWHVFTEHRHVFYSIFADSSERTFAMPVLTWERTAEGKRHWHFDALDDALVKALDVAGAMPATETPPELDALLGLVTVPYFQPELSRHWRDWQPLVKNGKSNYIGPASVPMMALLHRRALLNNSLLVRAAEEWLDAAVPTAETRAS
jgi:hypothetical protein